jgi:hypothetical protein
MSPNTTTTTATLETILTPAIERWVEELLYHGDSYVEASALEVLDLHEDEAAEQFGSAVAEALLDVTVEVAAEEVTYRAATYWEPGEYGAYATVSVTGRGGLELAFGRASDEDGLDLKWVR